MDKLLRKTIVFAFAAGFCCMSALTFAQANENDKTLLEGKWVLESASIQKITGRDTLRVDADEMKDNPFFALYDTLIFKSDTLIIPFSDVYSHGEYRYTDTQIEILFMAAPHVLDLIIEDKKIFFTHRVSTSCENCIYLVQTIYTKDRHENDD